MKIVYNGDKKEFEKVFQMINEKDETIRKMKTFIILALSKPNLFKLIKG